MTNADADQVNLVGRLHPSQRWRVLSGPVSVLSALVVLFGTALMITAPGKDPRAPGTPAVGQLVFGGVVALAALWPLGRRVLELVRGRVEPVTDAETGVTAIRLPITHRVLARIPAAPDATGPNRFFGRGGWPGTFALTAVVLALAGVGLYRETAHLGSGAPWLWGSAGLLLALAFVVGRAGTPALLGVFGTAFYGVFLLLAGPFFVQSLVLSLRGETTEAVITQIVLDPPAFASRDTGCSSCSHTHGFAVATLDGTPLRGAPYGGWNVHVHDHVPVVFDPRGQFDSRGPGEVEPVLDGLLTAAGALIALGVVRSAVLARRQRAAAKAPAEPAA
ncbi:hypothetical protein [Amycolatopsis sp. CA-230715]|uniref:hypothetical protein n=1 Tax=Amycolatopsis sp. CA-230715 TaxID=2745196 RepID=UPI001C02D723|nr:hypothetical protein [Amycolatopsis sp. CA-230715]